MFVFNVFAIAVLALSLLAQGTPVTEASSELEARGLLHARAPAADKCAAVQGCNKCVASKNGCGFNKSTFRCEKKGSGQVTTKHGCPLMNQMQGLFPAVNGVSPAGTIPAAVAAEWNRISNHVLHGETNNPNSGRHTKSAWLATHKGAKPTKDDSKTHILSYPNGKTPKTVWDDDEGLYDDTDIKNMCAVSIALREKAGLSQASFVVQTPFATPYCVESFTAGTGSCFPVGKAKSKLNKQCSLGQD